MFHNYLKCEDILQQVGLCPQAHKVLGKLATNLTFLTYLIGRLDLTRFRLCFAVIRRLQAHGHSVGYFNHPIVVPDLGIGPSKSEV